jgi:hypothetical protein
MAAANVYPLLEKLAGEPDALVRRSVLTAVAALAQPGAGDDGFPDALSEQWSDRVLPLLSLSLSLQSSLLKERSGAEESHSCVSVDGT